MASEAPQANVSIESVLDIQQHNFWQRFTSSQAFWVTVALIIICVVMSYLQPASFATADNFYNTTRNFSFIGIIALGMTAVIATGGIDLSVGSIMGLTAVACGLILEAGYPAWAAVIVGLLAGGVVGLINGIIIAYLGLSPFVTTLGMLAIARSGAVVLSGNRMLYNFGPGGPAFKALGSGAWHITPKFALSYPLLFLIVLTFILARGLQDDELGPPRAGDRGQRAGGPADRRARQSRQGAGLCRLGPIGGFRGHSLRRLGGLGDQRAWRNLRTPRHLGRGDRRRELDGRRGQRLRRLHRRGADLYHPQFASDGGRRFELAGHVRRLVLDRSGLPRETSRRETRVTP